MTVQYPITLAEFRAWLLTKRPTAFVGARHLPYSCPLAEYLLARGDDCPGVFGSQIADKPAPQWAAQFVSLADDGKPFSHVTARTALRLLDKVAHASLPEDEQDHERTALESEALRG